MAIKLEDWMPMMPWEGLPLPKFLKLYWPWYKAPTEEAPPTVYTCSYCGAKFSTYEELVAHISLVHPTEPTPPEVPSEANCIISSISISPQQPLVGQLTKITVDLKLLTNASGSKVVTLSCAEPLFPEYVWGTETWYAGKMVGVMPELLRISDTGGWSWAANQAGRGAGLGFWAVPSRAGVYVVNIDGESISFIATE